MSRRHWGVGSALVAGLTLSLLAVVAPGQQVLQYGFETRDPVWVPGAADAPYKELDHKLTDESAHTGQRSELIRFQAQPGTFVHYAYDPGRAPITDELNVSLWLKANRPGAQLLCRVVLPRERDPRKVDQPLTTLVRGDVYQLAGRWQQLNLRQPVKRLREQQQLLQAELKRDVITADAYVDRVVLNLYSGPGQTDVFIDDLEMGPLLEARPAAVTVTPGAGTPARPALRRAAEVQLRGNQLLVSGKRFFPRIIRHTGTPLQVLRNAGFNVVYLDESTPPGLVEDAVNLGFWLVPSLNTPQQAAPPGQVPGVLTSNDGFGRTVARFLEQDAVLWWDLGNNLAIENFATVARTAQSFRAADPMRPVSADVWDGFQRYSRGIEQLTLGVHRWPLMTSLELPAYRDWLTQRRQLATPGTFCWTWIQTHLPDWYTALVYDRGAGGAFTEPVGPLPEQVKLMAYTAIAAGYRGLGFWSDRFLADSHTGRDRLLAMALLNQELQLLEPLLVSAEEPKWIDTSHGAVKAAVIRCEKGVLVLPLWIGGGTQYVPGQSAVPELSLVVPQVPGGCQAWEVSPGQVRSLRWERVVGGMRVFLPEFGLSGAVVFTSDLGPTGLVVRLQDQQRRMAKLAAQWAHDQAKEEFTKVEKVVGELEQLGQALPDTAALLERARNFLDSSAARHKNGDHTEAYLDAQRALRPVRIVMRAYWERATRDLDTPVASPYAVGFFTLPRHYRFWTQLRALQASANVLSDGDFESPPDQVPTGWLVQEAPSLDEVTATARRVADRPHGGKQCLMLEVKQKGEIIPQALERTFLAIHSPAVKLPPGTFVRVTGWMRIQDAIKASPDGALFYDSAAGEPLAVRISGTTKDKGWQRFTLYRRVPETGTINVTLALSGVGVAFFDDIRIEPLVASGAPAAVVNRKEDARKGSEQ
jgi:hypothetical protein